MLNDAKILKLMVSLNRLTSTGTLVWEVKEPPQRLIAGTDAVIPLYFETFHKGQRYALYQERTKRFDGDREQFYAVEELVLVVLDAQGRALFELRDQYSALYDLLSTVRASLVDIDSLLNDLDDDQ